MHNQLDIYIFITGKKKKSCQNNFSVGTILDNDNKLRISMDGLSRKSKKCLKSLHNTKCLKSFTAPNV